MTGPARGDTHVLLVHPAVHDPDVHELAVRDLPHRARADLVEASRGRRPQLRETARRDVSEFFEDHPPRERASRCHPRLVASTDLVLHMRRQLRQGRRGGITEQDALDADQVGQQVAHHPPRTLRRQVPLAVAEIPTQRVDGLPLFLQDGDDRLLRSLGHGGPLSRRQVPATTLCGNTPESSPALDQCGNLPPRRPAARTPSRALGGHSSGRELPTKISLLPPEGDSCLPSACGVRFGDSFGPDIWRGAQ